MSELAVGIAPMGILLSDDLIFSSRITATARSLGLTIKTAKSSEAVEGMLQKENPSCLILDLANPGLEIAPFMETLGAICPTMPRVVAYGSHVDVASLQAARAAGCDPVLPRSKFVEVLPTDLSDWMK